MKWKLSLIALINLFCIAFPGNMIGCGPDIDPYDYYTSFFNNYLPGEKGYEPFYYTTFSFLFDEKEPEDAAHVTAAEWVNYCSNEPSADEAYAFVCQYPYENLSNLYYHLEKDSTLTIPDSVQVNKMTGYFMQHKDLEALGYLMYAKKVEPNVTGGFSYWEAPERDSLKMSKLIKNGLQLYNAASKPFVKLRYAYQVIRLAAYSGDNTRCVELYNQLMVDNTEKGAVKDLATSIKAGALYRLGYAKEAAYLYSKEFSRTPLKRVSNYISFRWCLRDMSETDRYACTELCKTDEEKANLQGMMILNDIAPADITIREVYNLAPEASLLSTLVTREVNKIEENLLSPELGQEKGGRKLYYNWDDDYESSKGQPWLEEARDLATLCHTMAQNKRVKERALFETAAAYLCYITKDYEQGKKYLKAVDKLKPTAIIKDQAQLTALLITINEQKTIDAGFESKLLPSIQWLEQKVDAEKKTMGQYSYYNPKAVWYRFYRNILSEVVAKRYHEQGAIDKEALCLGAAESISKGQWDTHDFIYNDMSTAGILQLNTLLHAGGKTDWEKYLTDHFPLPKDEVTNVIAMSHMRDYDFTAALGWLQKIKDPTVLSLERNPFGELLIDNQDDPIDMDNGKFTTIGFVKEMAQLMQKEKAGTATAAELYKLATGYYNLTYYGRAWEVVKDFRSGTDGYAIPKDATPFLREYYGCFTAHDYFQKAMQASNDKNFKARCLFMMAKCAQKQVQKPEYDAYANYDAYEKAETKYFHDFKSNRYFPQLVKEYSQTPFYKKALTACSYLSDFVDQH